MLGVVQAEDLLHNDISSPATGCQNRQSVAPLNPDSVDARDVVSILQGIACRSGSVVDEDGHFECVVTSGHISEAIVGEFRTEEGPMEAAIVRRDDGIFADLRRDGGRRSSEEFTGISLSSDRPYHTVAGFILEGSREATSGGR